MRRVSTIGTTIVTVLAGILITSLARAQTVAPVDQKALGEYVGVYQWAQNEFVYLQLWEELTAIWRFSTRGI